MAAMFNRVHRVVDEEEDEALEPPARAVVVVPEVSQKPDSRLMVSAEERRMLDRLQRVSSTLIVRINEVEIELDVLDVNKTPESICCIVQRGLRCRLPKSQDVVIELEGEKYPVAFLGAWHSFDWLGIQLAVFTILPEAGKPVADT